MNFDTPMDLIEEQADDYPADVTHRALALAEASQDWKRGATPKAVAAACVYAAWLDQRPRAKAGDGRPKQEDVAAEYGTNVVTLRERFHNIPEGV